MDITKDDIKELIDVTKLTLQAVLENEDIFTLQAEVAKKAYDAYRKHFDVTDSFQLTLASIKATK